MSTFSEWLKKTFPNNRTCSTDAGTEALLAVIRVVAKVSRGTIAAVKGGGMSPLAIVMVLGSVAPDLVQLIGEYEDIPCELASLNGEDYETLLKCIMFEFGFGSDHAQGVLDTALNIVGNISKIGPEVRGVLAEVQSVVK